MNNQIVLVIDDNAIQQPAVIKCTSLLQQLNYSAEHRVVSAQHMLHSIQGDGATNQIIGVISSVVIDGCLLSITGLPMITVEQLDNLEQLQQFIVQLIACHELKAIYQSGLSRGKLFDFHSRYKLLLLAHSQPAYRQIGPFVAKMSELPLTDFYQQYYQQILLILKMADSRQNHTNVLQHVQGYFRRDLDSEQRQQLSELINQYRLGQHALLTVISQLQQYLTRFPDPYLQQQCYFTYYPTLLILLSSHNKSELN